VLVVVYFIINSARKLLDTPLYSIKTVLHVSNLFSCRLSEQYRCTTVMPCNTSLIRYMSVF